jgi:uncharacterized protein (DUF302 family)
LLTPHLNSFEEVLAMRMTRRIWMTGCMALVLVAAGRWPVREDQEDDQLDQRTRITLTSKYGLDETVRQIERSARRSGLPVLARTVSRAPDGAALPGEDARVLILGDADGRTPVMQTDGVMSPELPLQLLIRQRADGQTVVSLSDPALMAFPDEIEAATREKVSALPEVLKSVIT